MLNVTNTSWVVNNGSIMDQQPEEEEEEMCSDEQLLIGTVPIQFGFCLLYLVIFCLGAFGNLLVSLVVIRHKHMHSVTNFFILNLAISDVVMCLFAVPFTPLQSFTGRWLFGDILCTLFPFSQGVSVYISTLTLTIIALDRFVVIIYPFRARMRIKTCFLLIIIIDLMACAFTAPYAFHVAIVTGPDGEDRCNETWEGMKRTVYGAFTNITQFVLPFVTIILCYTAIIRQLGRRSAQRPGAPRSAAKEEQERARNLKTNRMLISMVVVFGICWLPLNIINLLADLNFFPIHCWKYYHFMFFVSHVMAMSSTCYNPFLYGCHNQSFQTEFVKMVPALKFICGGSVEQNARSPQQQTQVAHNNRNGSVQLDVLVETDNCNPKTTLLPVPSGNKNGQQSSNTSSVEVQLSPQNAQLENGCNNTNSGAVVKEATPV